ncbi:TRAP transporter substrate-binding protein [Aurantimonas coralicida]|uniref:TRAP transporter substrate-binding protein n=1 Tax=Aurantimonas coralicida TaxID=182270 RepID=UPI00238BDDBC|nr:TRAP transporter substrate-binding protein [Aurantimonas coralicida]MDE0924148.1 TRAP transporter substrate-binding protein [Aurantimonas coralicida]
MFSFRLGAIAFAMAGSLTPGFAADVTINLGHVTQTSHPFHTGAEMFKKAVEEATDGRVAVQIFPSRQLGDDKELLEGVRLGTVDSAVVSSAIFGGYTPLMDALQLPFLLRTYDRAADAYTSEEGKSLLDGLGSIGVEGLGYYEGGLRHFLSNKGLVTKLEDFDGLKTRVVPAKLHLDTWSAIGVSPTPVAYGEIYSSLQTGVLDATEINVTSIDSEKFYEVAKNLTLTGQYFWPGVLVINPAKLASLEQKDREAVIDAANSTIRPQVEEAKKQDEAALESVKANGVTVAEFANTDAMIEKLQPVYDEYEAQDPRVKAFAESVRNAQNK